MYKTLIAWLHSLTPVQNVALAVGILLAYIIVCVIVLAVIGKDDHKVQHIPQESKKHVVRGYPVERWK